MKRYDLELTATGPVMEERKEGAYVTFSEVEQLQAKVYALLEERNSTGIAISNAILSGIVPEQHPLRSRLELLANHHKREQALADGMVAMAERCNLLTDLLREARTNVDQVRRWGRFDHDEGCGAEAALLLERIDAALAGTPQAQPDADWTEATTTPTEQDYRELQTQHDQLQSKYKAALDWLRWAHVYVEYADSDAGFSMQNDEVISAVMKLPELNAFLAQPVPAPTVPEGWQLVPVEATMAMISAATAATTGFGTRAQWDAMLAAAPKHQGGEPCDSASLSFSPA